MAKQVDRSLLEFLGIDRFPFITTALMPPYDNLFINREDDLKYMRTYIRTRQNCAIIGSQGSGKSSFLYNLKESMKSEVYGSYLQFAFPQDNANVRINFLRRVLRELILIVGENDELMKETPVDLFFELNRLDYSIIFETYGSKWSETISEIEGGITGTMAALLLPASVKAKLKNDRKTESGQKEQKQIPLHTEETIRETIGRIAGAIPVPVVFFIDELDKAGRYPFEDPMWDTEVMRLLELSREIMVHNNLIFVFALQEELQKKLKDAKRGKGDTSLLGLIPKYRVLELFDIGMTKDAVIHALNMANYKGDIDSFFERGMIELCVAIARGNPRLIMTHLSNAVDTAYILKTTPVSLECLRESMKQEFGDITEPKRWAILTNLSRGEALSHDFSDRENLKFLIESDIVKGNVDKPQVCCLNYIFRGVAEADPPKALNS